MKIVKEGDNTWEWWKRIKYWKCDRCSTIVEIDQSDVDEGRIKPLQYTHKDVPSGAYLQPCPFCGNAQSFARPAPQWNSFPG